MNKQDMIELAQRRAKKNQDHAKAVAHFVSTSRKGEIQTTKEVMELTGLSNKQVRSAMVKAGHNPIRLRMPRSGGRGGHTVLGWAKVDVEAVFEGKLRRE